MAKAPIPGQVKTRMQPELPPTRAAQLADLMLQQTAHTAHHNWRGEVFLCALPDPMHPRLRPLLKKYPLTPATQQGADLGARMLTALHHGIARAGCAAVLGCDVPHCSGTILQDAHALLTRGENAIGPAEDGGFYLLGIQGNATNEAPAALFTGVNWGTHKALQQVQARATTLGIHLSELPRLRDIDSYADLKWLANHDPAYQKFTRE